MIITLRADPRTNETTYVDKGPPEFVYRRVVGGLCWANPQARSPQCALCVMAEERDRDFSTGHHVIRILHECLAPSVEEMLDIAAGLQDTLKCGMWATPHDDPAQPRVQTWMKERAMRRAPRIIISPPQSVDFQVLHNLALKRTGQVKTMYFGHGSLAAAQYAGVRPDDFFRPPRIFPSLAACLYALSLLDMRAHHGHSRPIQQNQHAEGGY